MKGINLMILFTKCFCEISFPFYLSVDCLNPYAAGG